ncbi:hypothetical protein B0T25DRAFT_292502 [Lasiosphaeria hispida]|uniref:Uncharacterized protein n=1 Tax=Lasiosphaeria hispida TaxID=260671 RepID=A0AAJ0MB61_9PEZI|nr:hypothetical protein B0T25DRAFT_292502 [Lasiosphaeria hispida]
MVVSSFQPIPLQASGRVYLQLKMPGVPWYIYNDHFDGYTPNKQSDISALVIDLVANPSNGGILLGSANVFLVSPEEGGSGGVPRTEKAAEAAWTRFEGLRGWHRSPGAIESFIHYATQAPPSMYFRTVVLDSEYLLQVSGTTRYQLSVKINSLIGASVRDTNTEYGRNRVLDGQGVFQLVLAKTEEEPAEWSIVGAEGVEVRAVEEVAAIRPIS